MGIFFLYENEILEEDTFLYESDDFDFLKSLNDTKEENKLIFSEFKDNLINNNSNVKLYNNTQISTKNPNLQKIEVDLYSVDSKKLTTLDLFNIYKNYKLNKEPIALIIRFTDVNSLDLCDVITDLSEWSTATINVKKHKKNDYNELIKFLPKKTFNFVCDDYKLDLIGCTFIQYINNNKDTLCVLVNKFEFYA